MSILKEIITNKVKEVDYLKQNNSIKNLEKSIFFSKKTFSLKHSLKDKSGIISEFKRKSPSISDINLNAEVLQVAKGYELANSSAISILTDNLFFGGENLDLVSVRNQINIPILRKDFIIDEYQIIESKSLGADVILLIASCLSKKKIKYLSNFAKSINLEVILEVHSKDELSNLCDTIDVIGVNNRNLKKFKTDINISVNLATLIPNSFMKISESGISSHNEIKILKKHGYDGFLIGESFMREKDPVLACENFISKI